MELSSERLSEGRGCWAYAHGGSAWLLGGYPAWCVGASPLGPYLNEWDIRIESYVQQTETVPAPSEHLMPIFPCSVPGPLGQASSLVEDLHLAFPPIQHLDIESLLYVLSRTWGCKDKEFVVFIAFYDILSCPSLLGRGEMPHVWVPPLPPSQICLP